MQQPNEKVYEGIGHPQQRISVDLSLQPFYNEFFDFIVKGHVQ
jgi:hypothetical protein